MKRLTKRLGVRAVMALFLIVLVFVTVLPVKADEPAKPFKIYIPLFVSPRIEGLEPPEFGEEFIVSEPTGGSANGANIVFANENEGLVAWQQEVRVCPPDKTYCEGILQVFSQHFSTQTSFAEKVLLGESKFSISKEAETHEQKPLVTYHNPGIQTGGAGLTAALETSGWAGNPSVAWNPTSGNYLVAFWSNGNEKELPRIYAWQISAEGRLGAARLQVGNDGKDVYRQFYPSVAVAPNGRYLVVWEQDATDCSNCYQVFGQWLDQNTQPIGENFQISTGTWEQHPKIVWVAQKNAFLVVYMYPYIDWTGAHVEICGQWILASGEIGEPFAISDDTLDKGVPSLTVNSQGDTLVAWNAGGRIYGRLILSTGTLLGTRVLAKENGQLLNHPKVASFGKDGFLLVWEQFPPNGYADASRVRGKIFKVVKPKFFFDLSPGRPLLPENPLLVSGKPFQLSQNETNQRFPGVGTWDSNGLAVWEISRNGLWGRFFWQKTPVQ